MGRGALVLTMTRAWDDGVTWTWDRPVAGNPDPALDPLDLSFVRDKHLRAADDADEDEFISHLIKMSYREAERKTWRSLTRQTLRMILDRFPCGEIVVTRPPLIEVTSITYLDADGVRQTWDASPLPYDVVAPVGPTAQKGRIRPAYGEVWPTTRCAPDAVIVTVVAGYDENEEGKSDIPIDITHGRLLVIGEGYKQRSLSVHAFNQNPAIVQASEIWKGYRPY